MEIVRPLKLLFDTNVFYACVDISPRRQHQDAVRATLLKELINRRGCEVWLTAATRRDIDRAGSPELRRASNLHMRQWKTLEPLSVSPQLLDAAGYQRPLSPNDDVDSHMLAALDAEAVDFLITQDRALRRYAANADFGDRTMTIQGGIEFIERLFGEPMRFPTVRRCRAYTLPAADPIFESLRHDDTEFDERFRQAKREHRQCFVIDGASGLDAIAILKTETDNPHGLLGKILKICTFKIADHAEGAKRGELLLKSVFDHAAMEDHDQIYIEALSHHSRLVLLFERFGFSDCGQQTDRGETVLYKDRRPATSDNLLDPLEYHRRFGPPAVLVRDAFVVPIQPRWHNELFPEAQQQGELFGPSTPGNAILKAYLSRSAIRKITRGALVMFYRSEDVRAVTAIGVVDGLLSSNDPAAIRRYVGKRTVYTDGDIQGFCADGRNVLAILFRHDRILSHVWTLTQMSSIEAFRRAPQTIQQITSEGALSWIRDTLGAPT